MYDICEKCLCKCYITISGSGHYEDRADVVPRECQGLSVSQPLHSCVSMDTSWPTTSSRGRGQRVCGPPADTLAPARL